MPILDDRQVLWNQGIYLTTLFGKLLQAIFFGELRPHEVEVRFNLSLSSRNYVADFAVIE